MTYDYNIKSYEYEKLDLTLFDSPYSVHVYNSLTLVCKKVFGKNFTNGTCVRLDGCIPGTGRTTLKISQVHFFDFLLTNYLYMNYKKIADAVSGEEKRQVDAFYHSLETGSGVVSFQGIIEKKQLSNIFAVSCIVSDGENFIITKRNNNVGISNNFFSTTVTGIIDDADFGSVDPVLSCCNRELKEETGFDVGVADMVFSRIVCGDDKIQPIALVDVKVENVDNVVNSIKKHKGFFEESSGFFLYSKNEIIALLENNNALMTSAARTHLSIAIG